jgi:predicted TIM-barrel fold metal-dependent hydrolase
VRNRLEQHYRAAGYEVHHAHAIPHDFELRLNARIVHIFIFVEGAWDSEDLAFRARQARHVARLAGATAWIAVPKDAADAVRALAHPERCEGPRLCTYTCAGETLHMEWW